MFDTLHLGTFPRVHIITSLAYVASTITPSKPLASLDPEN